MKGARSPSQASEQVDLLWTNRQSQTRGSREKKSCWNKRPCTRCPTVGCCVQILDITLWCDLPSLTSLTYWLNKIYVYNKSNKLRLTGSTSFICIASLTSLTCAHCVESVRHICEGIQRCFLNLRVGLDSCGCSCQQVCFPLGRGFLVGGVRPLDWGHYQTNLWFGVSIWTSKIF